MPLHSSYTTSLPPSVPPFQHLGNFRSKKKLVYLTCRATNTYFHDDETHAAVTVSPSTRRQYSLTVDIPTWQNHSRTSEPEADLEAAQRVWVRARYLSSIKKYLFVFQ